MNCPTCGSWRFICDYGLIEEAVDNGPIVAYVYECAVCGTAAKVHPQTGEILAIDIPEDHHYDRHQQV